MIAVIGAERLWQLAGWTMLHYLWIGAALGLVAFAVRRATRRLSPGVRYGVAVLSLGVLISAPFAIAVYLRGTQASITFDETPLEREQHVKAGPLPAGFARFGLGPGPAASARSNANDSGEPARSLTERIEVTIEPLVSRLPWIWLAGTPLCLLVVASGLYGAERMRRGAILVIEGPVAEALSHARTALGMGRSVAIAVSDRIVSPLLLGIVRPLILLPASAVAGWSPDQLQMILQHELAHVRRWDNLVNLVQRIVEAALFYQPAVWLVSSWVRLEREHCCDAVVLGQGNEPQDYAETLASLAMPGISPRYAAAALASHQLVSRIRHILNVEDRTMKISRRALLTLVCGVVLLSSLVAFYAQQQADKELQSTVEEPKQTQSDTGDAKEATTRNSDAPKEQSGLTRSINWIVAAQRQREASEAAWREGLASSNSYLDALRGETAAAQSYVKTLEDLLAQFSNGKIDPVQLKEVAKLGGGATEVTLRDLLARARESLADKTRELEKASGSGARSDSDLANPKLATAADRAATPGETDFDTAARAVLKARRDEALTNWRAQKADLEGLQREAGALHKTIEDAGDAASPDLNATYAAALKAVQEGSAKEAIAREKYYEIRAGLDREIYKPGWSAAQLIGPPDAQGGREDRLAWSSATPDGQSEWIEVSYERPVEAVALVISESYNPGAIGSVKSFDANGKWQWVVENRPARPIDKDKQVTTLPLSERPVTKLRITIESVSVPGYNQIDAVGLLDAKGQMHWATSATASSDRSQPKSSDNASFDSYLQKALADPPQDDNVLKAIEFLKQHSHVHVKNMDCTSCHQIQAESDAAKPRLQALSRYIEFAQAFEQPAKTSAAASVAGENVREKQELERQQRLAPLRKEIDEINREIQKIREELDLQTQRDNSRIELERLRTQLGESRKAREAPQPAQRE